MKYTPYYMKDVYAGEAQEKFTVVSTFAGGGGSSTGYRLAGAKILAINEFVEAARDTYSANYPTTPIIPDDIKELTGKDILEVAGIGEGELDLLDGSPPCSAFSVAGRGFTHHGGSHKAGYGKSKHYSDEQSVSNIEDLFFEFIRVAKDIQPKTIIAENVKGLTIGEAKEYFNMINNAFDELGYDVCAKVLNSKHYGVPQARERTIFIGVRKDLTAKAGLSFMNIFTVFPDESREFVTLGEGIEGLEIDRDEAAWLTEKWTNTKFHKVTGVLFPQDPEKVISGENVGKKNLHFSCKKTSQYIPAPTLTAMGAAATTGGLVHWNEDRKFTIKELKRIMSLPEDFELTGSFNQKAERCGRMVPSLMMKAIANSVYEKVLRKL